MLPWQETTTSGPAAWKVASGPHAAGCLAMPGVCLLPIHLPGRWRQPANLIKCWLHLDSMCLCMPPPYSAAWQPHNECTCCPLLHQTPFLMQWHASGGPFGPRSVTELICCAILDPHSPIINHHLMPCAAGASQQARPDVLTMTAAALRPASASASWPQGHSSQQVAARTALSRRACAQQLSCSGRLPGGL